jgi:chromosome segregation ATPase
MLKSLELSGFKSFAKKTSLSFNAPVVSIVGPNGSGKSNVVEAIRFVLGEQSIKSLRGKGGSDMIFKGSKNVSQLSRASVTIVFDNSKKVFSMHQGGDSKLSLDFDEISITREVFADGSNSYRVNGSEVRLKDIVELLASVHIGSSGHHIISQGEADRLLSASPKDRRSMIEDALGLKVYQYRLRESERKLEKTHLNIKEVHSLRREIAPHLNFLKKQVEKIAKAQELRNDLGNLYKEYFGRESFYIKKESSRLVDLKSKVNEEIEKIDNKISDFSREREVIKVDDNSLKKGELETELSKLRFTEGELTRKLGRVEGSISLLESQLNVPKNEVNIKVSLPEIEALVSDLDKELENAFNETDIERIKNAISNVRDSWQKFIFYRKESGGEEIDKQETENKIEDLRASCRALENEISELSEKILDIVSQIENLKQNTPNNEESIRNQERAFYELKNRKTELESELRMIALEEESLSHFKNDFESELKDAGVLVGLEAARFSEIEDLDRTAQSERKKQLERLKIKLEDAGAAGGGEVVKEYEDTLTRDQFLAKELIDLESSIEDLRSLIRDLKQTIDKEFKVGIEKINVEFGKFFSLMFGGGSAFLTIVVEHKRASKDEEDEIQIKDEGELEFERGIEINISLPHKKVKELSMLSGGERSLTSIALLFAMSQVNPPPFLVLDETDAALDEANSRRYGDMIESLSKYSQLIVVTHNRETMSRANVLYGVTIGSDGTSKLLSIKFDEAVQIAK